MRLSLPVACLVALLMVLSGPARAGAWTSRECAVTISGSNWLLANAPLSAALTDSDGNFTGKPSHLQVKNHGKKTAYVSGTQVGGLYTIEPGETELIYLAIYQSPSKPVTSIQAVFKFWKD